MRRLIHLVRFASAGLLLVTCARALTIGALRVEHVEQPLAVDAVHPRFSWVARAEERGQRQTACQIRVASAVGNLASDRADVWDSGKVVSADNFGIEYAGPPLRSGARYYWQVRTWDGHDRPSEWSRQSWWQMAPLAPADWSAKWIGAAPDAGSPLLRRDFQLEKSIVRATAHAYAAGWYRLFVNGAEITERLLAPVNSNYPKGLFYDTYDVTRLLQRGGNALGLWLGYGYSQNYSKYGYRWDQPPMGFLQVEILFSDGSTQVMATDGAWKWASSPVVANDIYNGETYDARLEIPGWSKAGFDDRGWRPVILREAPPGPLKPCPFPGLKNMGMMAPEKITEPKPGVFIIDMGQNIAGWTRLQLRAPAGTKIVLRHAEELLPDGTLDPTTNRAAQATDTYIAAGRGREVYEPRFTYHGFRYVEMTGYPVRPSSDQITGIATHANVPKLSDFDCSDALLTQLHRNFRMSIANNLMGIPTDTASRDERTPCQMDSLAVEDAAIANFDMSAYYPKWLHDIAGDGGTLPNWTGDQVVLPYLLYWNYGDRRILEQHFDNMKQVVDKFTATAEENKHWAGGFGDWCAPNPDGSYEGAFSEGELVGRAFHYRCARIVAETATILGHPEDAARFTRLAGEIRDAFEKRFYQPATATYGSGRQVTSILPLAFDLAPAADRQRIADALARRITQQDKSHLDTGIFGTRYLFETLIDHGHADLAYRVLTVPGYPGYADQVAQGASTTWEQWNYRGSMQTHDHAMFAGPDATFFSHLGGIRAAAPGFRKIEIKPAMPAGLTFARCTRDTPLGPVRTHWDRTGDLLTLRVTIPVNGTAEVHMPTPDLETILESGQPAKTAAGVLAARVENDHAVVTIGSGNYVFTAPLPVPSQPRLP